MELIKTYQNSLGKLICENIIKIFNDNPNKLVDGITGGGLNKEFKNTKDLHSNELTENEEWNIIEGILRRELNTKLMMYYYDINDGKMLDSVFNPYTITSDSGFQIQQYKAKEGHYNSVHSDFMLDKQGFRTLTYLWYLNDVEEGGETLFHNGKKIRPETGKLLIFPALWSYPHSGLMPISNDKYILTGWIYSSF
jgi:hypothetical protein